jgi:hypothetical protein
MTKIETIKKMPKLTPDPGPLGSAAGIALPGLLESRNKEELLYQAS